jgi:hypothetical protein
MSDESTQTAGADAERGMRREPKEHYIAGMRASITRRSLLGALAFACALVGPIAVRAEVISVPSAEVVSVPPTDPTNSAASLPLPTVVRGSPPSTAGSVPICPPGYTLSPDYDYGCIEPSDGDRQSPPPLNMAELRRRALARMAATPPP